MEIMKYVFVKPLDNVWLYQPSKLEKFTQRWLNAG